MNTVKIKFKSAGTRISLILRRFPYLGLQAEVRKNCSVSTLSKPRALVRLRSPFPRTIPSEAKGLTRGASNGLIFFLIILSLYLPKFITNVEAAAAPSMPAELIVIFRNDDPSAISNFNHERIILQIFEKYNIAQTVGVIPYAAEGYWNSSSSKYASLLDNKEMTALLKEYKQKGLIEIALHGYQHQTNNFYSYPSKMSNYYNGLSEFSKISYSKQLEKIVKGKNILGHCFKEPVEIFIPPFNSYDKDTLRALEVMHFKVISASLVRDEFYPSGNIINISATTDIYQLPLAIKYAQDFVKKNNSSVVIVCLYHSWDIDTQKKIQILKSDLELIKKDNIKINTLGEFHLNYTSSLKQINKIKPSFFWKNKAENFCQLIGWLKVKSLCIYPGYLILDTHLLQRQLLKSKIICFLIYFIIISMGLFLSRLILNMENKLSNKLKIFKLLYMLPIIIAFFLFIVLTNKRYFGLSPGLGWKAELIIIFFLSLLIGNLFHFLRLKKSTSKI